MGYSETNDVNGNMAVLIYATNEHANLSASLQAVRQEYLQAKENVERVEAVTYLAMKRVESGASVAFLNALVKGDAGVQEKRDIAIRLEAKYEGLKQNIKAMDKAIEAGRTIVSVQKEGDKLESRYGI